MPLLLHAAAVAACPAVLAAACPAVFADYLNFRPTPEEPANCGGERRNTFQEVLPVQPRASATFPCAVSSGLMPRVTHCLEGHWVRILPGAGVMTHPRRRMTPTLVCGCLGGWGYVCVGVCVWGRGILGACREELQQ